MFLFLNSLKISEHKHIFSFCFIKNKTKQNKNKTNTKNEKMKTLPNIPYMAKFLVTNRGLWLPVPRRFSASHRGLILIHISLGTIMYQIPHNKESHSKINI